jgi:hypothetical protein
MTARYGARFGVFGMNWQLNGSGHGAVQLAAEATVYSSARAALSISIDNNIARYTSDRLIRMLCSGSLCLVERFPDCEGLGLVDGADVGPRVARQVGAALVHDPRGTQQADLHAREHNALKHVEVRVRVLELAHDDKDRVQQAPTEKGNNIVHDI